MKHTTEKLEWCTANYYQPKGDAPKLELTLTLEAMRDICSKHHLDPELGAGEASYAAFKDWLEKHDDNKEDFYGVNGSDINSLVGLFHQDLTTTARIEYLIAGGDTITTQG